MKCLLLFIGESFRLGNQNTRNRGSYESYNEQIKASNSHINFIEHIIQKFHMNSVSVFISNYNTIFDNDLLSIYRKYLIGNTIYHDLIGLDKLFHDSINRIENIEKYDFVLFIRIDLFLKEHFKYIFNPSINMILFPTICFIPHHKHVDCPRVNDTMLFIPKKYFNYIKNISISHYAWYILINNTDLTCNDMDTMIHTYHDSDSFKDFNPLYFIVNRPENKRCDTPSHVKFNKYVLS
jgi:hypothetical protein